MQDAAPSDPVRVLVVDDSPVVRQRLTRELDQYERIHVVGSAPDPFAAREEIARLDPEVLVLDLEMPRMDGLTFLRRLMAHRPMPVVVVSSLTPQGAEMATACMQAGAISVLCKPSAAYTVGQLSRELARVVIDARRVNVGRLAPATRPGVPRIRSSGSLGKASKIIAIGSSTGGTNALLQVLKPLPAEMHGIVIVQHMPAQFTATFAKRLDSECALRVREARDGDVIERGVALLAPGGKHMRIVRNGVEFKVRIVGGPAVCRHQPSVEVLFESVARSVGDRSMGIMLTGMGADGATGMRAMRDAGAFTVAQDEQTCVVFGMPREAIAAGGVDEVLPLQDIAGRVVEFAEGRTARKGRAAG